jgi:release factor glutamine methyltransferase
LHLVSGGKLYFEINEKYGAETAKLLSDNNFSEIEVIKDMQGKDRMVKGIKNKTT